MIRESFRMNQTQTDPVHTAHRIPYTKADDWLAAWRRSQPEKFSSRRRRATNALVAAIGTRTRGTV